MLTDRNGTYLGAYTTDFPPSLLPTATWTKPWSNANKASRERSARSSISPGSGRYTAIPIHPPAGTG
ncbi:MAG: hypothetical protein ACHRHE_02390 [Tepidisphaerales bacterium]